MTEPRPHVLLVAGWLCLLAGTSAAQEHAVRQSVMVYSDNNQVSVIAPRTSGTVGIGPARFNAEVGFDLITAASVDLVTAASPAGFEERRTEVEVSTGWDFGEGHRIGAGYGYSTEPDYATHRFFVSHAIDLFHRHSSVTTTYSFGRSEVGRSGDDHFSEDRSDHRAELTWTQVLTPTIAIDMVYGVAAGLGYLESPYRFVPLYGQGAHRVTALSERVPDSRIRHTLTGRVRTRLIPKLFGILDYRFYADSWGVLAHTLTARLSAALLHDQLIISVEGRGYVQTAADFYQRRYQTFPKAPEWRTGDKELGPMWTGLGGIRIEWSPPISVGRALRIGAGIDGLHMAYTDFEYLDARSAFMFIADIAWEL